MKVKGIAVSGEVCSHPLPREEGIRRPPLLPSFPFSCRREEEEKRKITRNGDSRGKFAEYIGAGKSEVGVRGWKGRRGEDDVQLDPIDFVGFCEAIGPHYIHRSRPQPKRRFPATIHQDPHARQWILQPLRHGEPSISIARSSFTVFLVVFVLEVIFFLINLQA